MGTKRNVYQNNFLRSTHAYVHKNMLNVEYLKFYILIICISLMMNVTAPKILAWAQNHPNMRIQLFIWPSYVNIVRS